VKGKKREERKGEEREEKRTTTFIDLSTTTRSA
jgi:hypothetical protein